MKRSHRSIGRKSGLNSGHKKPERVGDASKIVEITIEDEDEDYEVIHSYKVFTTSQTTDNSVTEDTKSTEILSTKPNPKPNDKYICIFCPKSFPTSESAKDHYFSHCGVSLDCNECHQKFGSLKLFRSHNPNHLDSNKMGNLNEFMAAKKWCDSYIDSYVEKREQIVEDFVFTNHMFCPICHKIRQNSEVFGKTPKTLTKFSKPGFDEEFIRTHLHQHFQYFPFECIDCSFEDKKTNFCLNANSRQHLLEVHSIENALTLNANELQIYFKLKKSIKKLDEMIDYCFEVTKGMQSFANNLRTKCSQKKIFKK